MYIDFHNHIDFYKDEEIDSVINWTRFSLGRR